MPQHLYAESLLTPGLGISFQWRYQNNGRNLLDLIDPDSPVVRALGQSIDRFENTVFELTPNKPTLIEWANSQEELQDAPDRRELRLGAAHVFQQSIELFQGMQMMTDREEDPDRLSLIHHTIGDVMGFIGQRSGSVHFLEQAALSYEQALEIRTQDDRPADWARTTYNLALVMQAIGELEGETGLLKQALGHMKQAVNLITRKDDPEDWAAALSSVGNVLYRLGTHRRGSRTLEQSLVAYRNVLSERTQDKNEIAWIITQNNVGAVMQALGEHEEDIGSLEASIPIYDAVLKVLRNGSETLPMVTALVSANRASALYALAGESDFIDMAEASVVEYDQLAQLFDGTDYTEYKAKANDRKKLAEKLVATLQV